MVKNTEYKLEWIRQKITDVCETLFGEPDRGKYFLVKDSTVYDVEMKIMETLRSSDPQDQELAKKKYLNMCTCILPIADHDVMIKML